MYPVVALKKNQDRRLLAGHRWVFANEITGDQRRWEPGTLVSVHAASGRPLGVGYINPHSLIAVRILDFQNREIGESWLEERIREADQVRRNFYERRIHRLVYADADGLPGLIVDRYEDILVVQVLTAGMEKLREMVASVLQRLFAPRTIVWRGDAPARKLEGLPAQVEVTGEPLPENHRVRINDLTLAVDLFGGQKTGLFLDQANNWARIKPYLRGGRVWDLFAHLGGWGLTAAENSSEVVFVESQEPVVALLQRNLEINAVRNALVLRDDVFRFLARQQPTPRIVVLDPPALIKNRKRTKEGEAGYLKLNTLVFRHLSRGILFTFSCSSLLSSGDFQQIVRRAAAKAGRRIRILEELGHGPDHPLSPAMPETRYLKGLVLDVNSIS